MYGPGLIPPPRPSLVARVATVVLRVVLTLVPLATIGFLAWLPLLWLALVRRRTRDWMCFGAMMVLFVGAVALIGSKDDDRSWQTNVGVGLILCLAAFSSVYFLVSDLRRPRARSGANPWHPGALPGAGPYPPYPPYPAYPPPPAEPTGRIVRVMAELDELSAYLREQEGR